MDDWWSAEELAAWLVSPALRWVRRSGLAPVLARCGEEVLQDQRAASREERAVGGALLGRWDCALAAGRLWEVAALAAAFASWATGQPTATPEAAEGRAVDLVLRAGVVASDGHQLARLRGDPAARLRETYEQSASLAHVVAAEPAASGGVLALDLEDVAARGAGEALVALLLAGELA
jgi:hypothetical protein